MQVLLITQGSTVGHSEETLTLFLKELGYNVFKTDQPFGPNKYVVSHPSPEWAQEIEDLVKSLNSQPNYVYMVEAFAVQ